MQDTIATLRCPGLHTRCRRRRRRRRQPAAQRAACCRAAHAGLSLCIPHHHRCAAGLGRHGWQLCTAPRTRQALGPARCRRCPHPPSNVACCGAKLMAPLLPGCLKTTWRSTLSMHAATMLLPLCMGTVSIVSGGGGDGGSGGDAADGSALLTAPRSSLVWWWIGMRWWCLAWRCAGADHDHSGAGLAPDASSAPGAAEHKGGAARVPGAHR